MNMIVLDTNVLSELLKPTPQARVVAWLSRVPAALLFTTTITQAEILYGIELLSASRRKAALRAAVACIFAQDFSGRVLPFDSAAAATYAQIAAARRSAGRPIAALDAQIAAIARARGAALATRDVAHFADCEIPVLDPWLET